MAAKTKQFTGFKKGKPCEAGLERLWATHTAIVHLEAGDPFQRITESDIKDACPEELMIDRIDIDDNVREIDIEM